jgi:hypothetical protein
MPDPTPYAVGDGPVTLKVTVGEGQFGSSGVYRGAERIEPDGGVHPLGDGPALDGTSVYVASTVTLTDPARRRTSVTYRLEGGPEPLEYTREQTVPGTGGGTADYEETIAFHRAEAS